TRTTRGRAGGPGGRRPSAASTSDRLSEQLAERPQIQVQVLVGEPEDLLQLVRAVLQRHQRLAQLLDLLVGEPPTLDAPDGLALHRLTKQLDQRQHRLTQATRHVLAVRLDPHSVFSSTRLYGGHGPVSTSARLSRSAASAMARAR